MCLLPQTPDFSIGWPGAATASSMMRSTIVEFVNKPKRSLAVQMLTICISIFVANALVGRYGARDADEVWGKRKEMAGERKFRRQRISSYKVAVVRDTVGNPFKDTPPDCP